MTNKSKAEGLLVTATEGVRSAHLSTARTEAPAPNPILDTETVWAFRVLDEAVSDARIYGEFYMSQTPEMAERRREKVGKYLGAMEFLRAEIERLYYVEAGFR